TVGIMLRMRTLPAGFIAPCLPTKTDKLPSGSDWLHEIKHDGFRIIARKKGAQVRLYSRPGPSGIGSGHHRHFFLPQSSSASRLTEGAAGFLLLIQCRERPER